MNCHDCNAACCRYVAIEIDAPETKQDKDEIRWMLLHRSVSVCVDHDDCWTVELKGKCSHLVNNRCSIYSTRPDVCRNYPPKGMDCERGGADKLRFESVNEFEEWLG